jgi:quercetin 2,3-dioxygenase
VIAARRFRSEQPGITSWHCFSAGDFYDPDAVSFGPVVGLDEHRVAAGAGFDWHPHRGVQIASWVLAGTLRHEDAAGVRLVGPGAVLVQRAGPGVRHRETNASDVEPLRFVQTTVLGDAGPSVELMAPPVQVGPALLDVRPGLPTAADVAPDRLVLPLEDSVLVIALGSSS